MNKDLKKEEIELLKTKYGIDLEKDKWWCHFYISWCNCFTLTFTYWFWLFQSCKNGRMTKWQTVCFIKPFNPFRTSQEALKGGVGFQIQILLEPNPSQNLTSRRWNDWVEENGAETKSFHHSR